MKMPISLAVAAVLTTGSLLPATAQAKSKPSHHDDKFRVSSHHHHRHHDHSYLVKVWVRGHLVWHRGHKHWVPGHYEYRRVYL